jgi:hypothetical protein
MLFEIALLQGLQFLGIGNGIRRIVALGDFLQEACALLEPVLADFHHLRERVTDGVIVRIARL